MKIDLARYRELFIHRDDVYAVQHSNGSYNPVPQELDDIALEEHLSGYASYGTYVIRPSDDTVKWVCFDLDTYDNGALEFLKREVENLVISLPGYLTTCGSETKCLLLESSGGKGYHIWLFFDAPVPARDARAWAEPVRASYDDQRGMWQNEWPALEIFPKQDRVMEGGYGNLVKLPFGKHAKTGRWSKMPEEKVTQGWAKSLDTTREINAALIPAAPERVQGHESGRGITRFPCVSKIIEEGVGQGNRDNAMLHFARYACGQGLPEDLVREWCERVNMQFDPPLSDSVVAQKVQSAAGMESPHPSCNLDWLNGFCPGGEKCCAPWNEDRPKFSKKESVETMSDLTREQWLAQRRAQ